MKETDVTGRHRSVPDQEVCAGAPRGRIERVVLDIK